MTTRGSLPPTPPGVPVVGHAPAFARDPFGFVRRSVNGTGDVFRMRLFGRDVHVVAHPTHVRTILRRPDAFRKPDDFRVAFGEAVLSVHGEQWRRQREAMGDIFGPNRITAHADRMAEVAAERIADWSGDTVRLDTAMRGVALDNLFEVVLGASLDPAEIDELAEAAASLNLYFKPTTWALPDWVPTPARRDFRRGKATVRDQARRLLDGADVDGDGLIPALATLESAPDSGFDREEVLDQVVGMLFAGHETTALAMTYGLHQIAAHDDVTERFDDELDGIEAGTAGVEGTPYLDRVVNETLRLYPPVHALPRITDERVEIGEYVIPAGEQLLVSIWNLHHDPRFYDDPWAFDPDRWLGASPEEYGHAFIPFGAGPRVCLGRHFSRTEMKAVFTAVGRRYRIDAEGSPAIDPQMTSQPAAPVTVSLQRR